MTSEVSVIRSPYDHNLNSHVYFQKFREKNDASFLVYYGPQNEEVIIFQGRSLQSLINFLEYESIIREYTVFVG